MSYYSNACSENQADIKKLCRDQVHQFRANLQPCSSTLCYHSITAVEAYLTSTVHVCARVCACGQPCLQACGRVGVRACVRAGVRVGGQAGGRACRRLHRWAGVRSRRWATGRAGRGGSLHGIPWYKDCMMIVLMISKLSESGFFFFFSFGFFSFILEGSRGKA